LIISPTRVGQPGSVNDKGPLVLTSFILYRF
jgi:hypothetical protein